LNLTSSRSLSRQLVAHGNVTINGKKVDVPSYQVKPGQQISVSTRSAKFAFLASNLEKVPEDLPKWVSRKGSIGVVDRLPTRSEIDPSIKENLIIEFYSR
jgi:small subunit ribosomal protein S4